MKKQVFMALLAALTLAGCSHSSSVGTYSLLSTREFATPQTATSVSSNEICFTLSFDEVLANALERAKAQGKDALLNPTTSWKQRSMATKCATVSGKAVSVRLIDGK